MMRYLNCLDLQFVNESLCWTNAPVSQFTALLDLIKGWEI